MFSLMVIGTPSSGERGSPARQRASAARASARARSALTRYIALMRGSQESMRASAARVTCTGESSPCAYAAASSPALSSCIAVILPATIYSAPMLRPLLLAFALASPAHAAQEVRLWHALDPATDAQLARHAAEYNAVQHEFR